MFQEGDKFKTLNLLNRAKMLLIKTRTQFSPSKTAIGKIHWRWTHLEIFHHLCCIVRKFAYSNIIRNHKQMSKFLPFMLSVKDKNDRDLPRWSTGLLFCSLSVPVSFLSTVGEQCSREWHCQLFLESFLANVSRIEGWFQKNILKQTIKWSLEFLRKKQNQ